MGNRCAVLDGEQSLFPLVVLSQTNGCVAEQRFCNTKVQTQGLETGQ